MLVQHYSDAAIQYLAAAVEALCPGRANDSKHYRNSSKQTHAFTAHGSGGNEGSWVGGRQKIKRPHSSSSSSSISTLGSSSSSCSGGSSNCSLPSTARISPEYLKPAVKLIVRAVKYIRQVKFEFRTESVVGYYNEILWSSEETPSSWTTS